MGEQETSVDCEPVSLDRLRGDYANLQAAHQALLERVQSEGAESDEVDTLRDRVKALENDLRKVTEERDELNSTVRDLRVRVEESRRAIMRLQGQGSSGGGGVGASTSLGATSGADGAHASSSSSLGINGHNKADARRSMLASWNPRELPNGLGVITTPASPSQSDRESATQTPEELAELKKSKRASLAFGPHAQGTIARRMHGHRRIASSSRVGAEDGEVPSAANFTGGAGGLRELHLGSATMGPSSGTSSKRTSVMGSNLFRSPTTENMDLPSDEAHVGGLASAVGSLLMPQRSIRRLSNSSSISGGAHAHESEGALAPPRAISRMSQSPSQASVTSPIKEDIDGSEEEEPQTATTATYGFAKQQQSASASTSTYQLQRSVMESKARLRDRDDQIVHLKREVDALRLQLDDATDARKASEACLQALRDFVKAEGGEGGDVTTLKGVKLPPLPTDKDSEQLEESNSLAQGTASSAWRSIGNSFAGFSRKAPTEGEGGTQMSGEKGLPAPPPDSGPSTGPISPSAQLSTSFGNLWSRATAGTRESISASSVSPSEGTSGPAEGTADSRHTSIVSTPAVEQNAPAASSPSAGFKGFAWFSKRTVSNAGDSVGATSPSTDSAASGAAIRVSSPPFANLDNHVLTLDQVNSASPTAVRTASYNSLTSSAAGSRKASVASSSAGTPVSQSGPAFGSDREPTGRTKKAMEKSEAVDEDNGFVPPSF